MKYKGNFFSLPNEIFLLGLSPGELAVYCYLRRCENQKTHQCWPSYKTIGEAVGMCANTVSRHVKKCGAYQSHNQIGHNTQRDFAVHSAAAAECDHPTLGRFFSALENFLSKSRRISILVNNSLRNYRCCTI